MESQQKELSVHKPGVYPWLTTIKLKFPGIPFSRKVGFRYEMNAWLLAYDALGVEIDEFVKLDPEVQITAIHYGAAVWEMMTHRRRVYFSLDQMIGALNKASKKDNILLANTMGNAQFPKWFTRLPDEKKKTESSS